MVIIDRLGVDIRIKNIKARNHFQSEIIKNSIQTLLNVMMWFWMNLKFSYVCKFGVNAILRKSNSNIHLRIRWDFKADDYYFIHFPWFPIQIGSGNVTLLMYWHSEYRSGEKWAQNFRIEKLWNSLFLAFSVCRYVFVLFVCQFSR